MLPAGKAGMTGTVRVNLYRVAGKGRDQLPAHAERAHNECVTVERDGNFYSISDCHADTANFSLGRIRRLQERDIPDIGDRTGNDQPLPQGQGLAHRAYYLYDPELRILLWLSSHNTCGPTWLKKIVEQVGCRIEVAVYLDSDAYDRALKVRDSLTAVSIAIGTDYGANLGVPITDSLINSAEEMNADIVELTFKASPRSRKEDGALTKIISWNFVKSLYWARREDKKKNPIRKLKVEGVDPISGEFVNLNLLRERGYVEMDCDEGVQQMSPMTAYNLLRAAHREAFGS